ncbi:ORF79 [White spot syndrome virus]|uniref:Wsv134 n=13 Tax=White spot syndrome virus TaxID=342409 RepID=Q77J72_WSSVS|nr:wsv134 [Shrimp white spot syndrome virus]YP_009220517.1 hypothetical protein SWSSV_gp043 [White spot syndrome virus]AYW76537.1 hypothetical protein [Procambarus clarkii virus]AAK77748.1 ORF79 [White spot syndrome virus]AAL33138.1 wsv134 [Shrimp white spot syndrome virus]AAL89057.1 WSSV189 [Shrimp white spot syndrome virus]AEA75466.1 hypothetical protein [White spot syndrome virus]
MEWINQRTSREDLFNTYTGNAVIRSAAKQALAIEKHAAERRGEKAWTTSAAAAASSNFNNVQQDYTDDDITQVSIANSVLNNPFLKRYAKLIDNLAISSLPPDIEDDVIIHTRDASNSTVRVDGANIYFAIIDGDLCVYPKQYISDKVLCGSLNREKALFYNSSKNKWTYGCNLNFDIVDAAIMKHPDYKEETTSTKHIRKILGIGASEKLNITHYLNYFIQ